MTRSGCCPHVCSMPLWRPGSHDPGSCRIGQGSPARQDEGGRGLAGRGSAYRWISASAMPLSPNRMKSGCPPSSTVFLLRGYERIRASWPSPRRFRPMGGSWPPKQPHEGFPRRLGPLGGIRQHSPRRRGQRSTDEGHPEREVEQSCPSRIGLVIGPATFARMPGRKPARHPPLRRAPGTTVWGRCRESR